MLILNKYKDPDTSNAEYIGRGSSLGNPFVIGKHGGRIDVIYIYEKYLIDRILLNNEIILSALNNINNKNLLCFCSPKPCHGQVIKKHFNLLSKGSDYYKSVYKLPDDALEGINHINISSNSVSELGRLLNKVLVKSLKELDFDVKNKYYYDKLSFLLEKHIIDNGISSDLTDNILPLTRYKVIKNKISITTNSYWLINELYRIRHKLGSFKIITVAGSRSINDYELVKKAFSEIDIKVDCIVSGGAKGIDQLGERLAKDYNLKLITILPYWDELGKKAGMIRNMEMFNYSDALLAIWDGESNGTKHMINLFKKSNKSIYLKTM